MLSNPKAGWCELKIGNFKGTPSYLTDVPIDMLTAFIVTILWFCLAVATAFVWYIIR